MEIWYEEENGNDKQTYAYAKPSNPYGTEENYPVSPHGRRKGL